MTGVVATVGGVVAGGLLGAVAHELTHWAVARAGGRETRIDWRGLDCYHRLPDSGATLLDRAVGPAPFALGLAVGVGGLVAGVGPSLPLVAGWAVYTGGGIPGDFRLDVEPERRASA